jgi:hypothetical protein
VRQTWTGRKWLGLVREAATRSWFYHKGLDETLIRRCASGPETTTGKGPGGQGGMGMGRSPPPPARLTHRPHLHLSLPLSIFLSLSPSLSPIMGLYPIYTRFMPCRVIFSIFMIYTLHVTFYRLKMGINFTPGLFTIYLVYSISILFCIYRVYIWFKPRIKTL